MEKRKASDSAKTISGAYLETQEISSGEECLQSLKTKRATDGGGVPLKKLLKGQKPEI